jgi:ketosteroid isomerase-like protein
MSAPAVQSPLGAAFAEAFAAKDFEAVAALLHPDVDFRGLTPNRTWQASAPGQVVDEILRMWLEDSDVVEEVLDVQSDTVADTARVGYRLRGHNPDGPFVMEQQAYLRERDGRIGWMRVLCSGMRPLESAPPPQ